MNKRKLTIISIILLGVGLLFITIGTVIIEVFPKLYNSPSTSTPR